jgi:hypothetical protein
MGALGRQRRTAAAPEFLTVDSPALCRRNMAVPLAPVIVPVLTIVGVNATKLLALFHETAFERADIRPWFVIT